MSGADALLKALDVLINTEKSGNDDQLESTVGKMVGISKILEEGNESLGYAWRDIANAWSKTQQTVKAILSGIYKTTLSFSNSTLAN